MAGENSWTALLASWWERIKAAFMRSVRAIIDFAQIGRIAERLERGDIEGAVREVGLDQVHFRELDKAIVEAFEDGGKFTAKRIPAIRQPDGHRVVVQFDVRNPVAERILKEESAKVVRDIVDDQRAMIRETLRRAMEAGQNPREAALDLVGRINPVTKQRSGGSIGLTQTQEEWVRAYEAELRSANPRAALARALRDKRFDRSVVKAAETGVPLSEDAIQKMVTAYKNRALRYRAENIARTESLSALHQAKMEALRQAIEKGLDPSTITLTWHTAGDKRVRHTHQGMNGQTVKYGEKFTSPSGAKLAHPGDPNAPASETINCFAPWSRIHLAGLKAVISRQYTGRLVELSAGGMVNLAVTPNHPILTDRGWIAAGEIMEGDDLVYCFGGESVAAPGAVQVKHADAGAQELGDAAKALGENFRPGLGRVNLHGEMPDHEVDVVALPVELRDGCQALSEQCFGQSLLAGADVEAGRAMFARLINAGDGPLSQEANSAVSGGHTRLALTGSGERGGHPVACGNRWARDVHVVKTGVDDRARNSEFFGNAIDRPSSVDELPDARVVGDAVCEMPLPGAYGNSLHAGHFIDGQIEVSQALVKHPRTDTEPVSHLISAQALPLKLSDAVEVWLALLEESGLGGSSGAFRFSPIKVDRVSHVDYSGLVYNFETSTNLIVSEGVIAHNCRCTVSEKIDFMRGLT